MMNGSTILFYLLAALTLSRGIMSIATRHIFRAAIYLLFTLIGIAGLYFWLAYEFIAAVQIVVYGEKLPKQKLDKKIWAALAVFCAFALTMVQVAQYQFPLSGNPTTVTVRRIGEKMMSMEEGGYALPFEIISMLLLAAMVGCIVIATRSKPEIK